MLIVVYHSTRLSTRVAATSSEIMEMQLPFLTPAVGPSSVSLFCRQRENGKSGDHPSGGYVTFAPESNMCLCSTALRQSST